MDGTYYFSREIRLQHHECGPGGTFRLQSILDHFQDIAQEHVAAAGLGVEALAARGMMWVLSRIRLGCGTMDGTAPLALETWPDGTAGIFVRRQFRIGPSGCSPSLWATSQWLILDRASFKPVRPEKVLSQEMLNRHEDSLDFGELQKIIPRELPVEGMRYEVRFSHLDRNNHLNNAHYGSFIADILASRDGRLPMFSELQINFCHQALFGDRIDVRADSGQDGDLYIDGRSPDGKTLYFTALAQVGAPAAENSFHTQGDQA